jgi:hypothetical protein
MPRSIVLLLLLGVPAAMGPAYRTANFLVEAPTSADAERFAAAAERHRAAFARHWLGAEAPPWPEPCWVTVSETPGPPGGRSMFHFAPGGIRYPSIALEGPPDRLIETALPHEIAHVLLAGEFGRPLPRWADEGIAILTEPDPIRLQHRLNLWRVLTTPGRPIPLRQLLTAAHYPDDKLAFYAEGHSLAEFLVDRCGRAVLLAFLREGLGGGDWDAAVSRHCGLRDVGELEAAWSAWVWEGYRRATAESVAAAVRGALALWPARLYNAPDTEAASAVHTRECTPRHGCRHGPPPVGRPPQ